MPMLKLGPPYGPPANLRTIFAAWRDRGTPAVVDREWFGRIGLSANLATRNVHALRFLRLIDDDRRPTELAERLRSAPGAEFARTLEAIVRTAYADVWASRDPAVETRARIDDAFRHATPAAQRARMVACFIDLCRQARILERPGPAVQPAPRPDRVVVTSAQRRQANAEPPQGLLPEPTHTAKVALLLAKFPDFDPVWPDSVKDKWFDAFARLREDLLR